MKVFAQVDALNGLIHRLIEGVDVCEYDPALVPAYAELLARVTTVLRFDRRLREGLTVCDPMFREAICQRQLRQTTSALSENAVGPMGS